MVDGLTIGRAGRGQEVEGLKTTDQDHTLMTSMAVNTTCRAQEVGGALCT